MLTAYNLKLNEILKNFYSTGKGVYHKLDDFDKIKLERQIYNLLFGANNFRDLNVKISHRSIKEEFVKTNSRFFELCYFNNMFSENILLFANIIYHNLEDMGGIASRKPHSYLNIYIILFFLKHSHVDQIFKNYLISFVIREKKLLSYQHFLTFINYSSTDIVVNKNYDLYKPYNPFYPQEIIESFLFHKSQNKETQISIKDVSLVMEYINDAVPVRAKSEIVGSIFETKLNDVYDLLSFLGFADLMIFLKNLLLLEYETEDIRYLIMKTNNEIYRKIANSHKLADRVKLKYYFDSFITYRYFIEKDILNDFFIKIDTYVKTDNEDHELYFYNLAEEFIKVYPDFMATLFLRFYEERITKETLTKTNSSYLMRMMCYRYEKVQLRDRNNIKVHLDYMNNMVKDFESFASNLRMRKLNNTSLIRYINSFNDLAELMFIVCYMHAKKMSSTINTDTFEYMFTYIINYFKADLGIFSQADRLAEVSNEANEYHSIVYIYWKLLSNKDHLGFKEFLLALYKYSEADSVHNHMIIGIKREILHQIEVDKYSIEYSIEGLLCIDYPMFVDLGGQKVILLFPKRYTNNLNSHLKSRMIDIIYERLGYKYMRIDYKDWINKESYKDEIITTLKNK
jgi:hypothetical protein